MQQKRLSEEYYTINDEYTRDHIGGIMTEIIANYKQTGQIKANEQAAIVYEYFAPNLFDKKYNVRIVDTRKNTPNFRLFEKYSATVGANYVHRFNLSDCVMLKDNHIALYGGSITKAVQEVRKHLSHAHKIEIECDTLEQVKEALENNVDIIMLDNMTCEQMSEACKLINKKAIVEASGCVTFDNVEEIAKTGVDVISTSAIVMKAPTLDLAFDYNPEN